MTSPRALAVCLAIAAAFAVLLATPAGAQDAAAFERVEYRDADARPGEVESLALVAARDAEIVEHDGSGHVVRGTWTVVRGPVIRFVGPDKILRFFPLRDDDSVKNGDADQVLRLAQGRRWHQATYADPARQGLPEDFMERGLEAFVLHDDGTADWIARPDPRAAAGARSRFVAVEREKTAADNLVLKLPNGTRRVFVRDGAHWRDRDSGTRFESGRVRRERIACQGNLVQLAEAFVLRAIERPGRPPYDGTTLLLSWRKGRAILPQGMESVLRCPGDPHLRKLDDAARKAYDDVDLQNPPDDLCSYAARDFRNFPLAGERREDEIILCCRQGRDGRTPHHPDGICVAYDNGRSRFLTKEDLGIDPEDEIVVGPDSKSTLLRKMLQLPGKK